MGYSTYYKLETHCIQPSELQSVLGEAGPDFPAELEKIVGYDPLGEPCKWYEHEADMKTLAKAFPGYGFTLKGEGEECGDMWVKSFFRNQVHIARAKITFEPTPQHFFTP